MKIAIENLNRVKMIKQFTHKKLAEKTGYSRNSIQKLFSYHNNSKTRLDLVVTVCKALDIDFPSIFDRKTENYYGHFMFNDDSVNALGTEYYLRNFVNRVQLEIKNSPRYSLKITTGLSESTISDLLNFKTRNPRVETLIKIAEGLNISISEMFR